MTETLTPIERALTPSDRTRLQSTCDRVGIPWQTWRRVSWLRIEFETLAVEAEADRIQLHDGGGRGDALANAAERIGVDYGAHRQRIQRARRDAYDPARDPECDKMSLTS